MPEDKNSGELAPRKALGIPVEHQTHDAISVHKAGYEAGPVIARTSARTQVKKGAVLPPAKAAALPRTSLAERIRARLAQKEE